jgi:hypothetical protein
MEADHASGQAVERRLCLFCPYPTNPWLLAELSKQIFAEGKCERCGGEAFSVSGLPGPDRRVLCRACSPGA